MGKNIALTGATGLLGSHLANYFIKNGDNVYVLVKDENYKSILSNKVFKVYGNINNKSDIEYFVQKSNPDYFIHLAAQTQAYDSLKHPYHTFYNNVVGTLNVLETLREYNECEAIVIASSDKSYGELEGKEYFEDHRLNGVYPYDASKSMTDIISNSYRQTYYMPIVTTRACNIYGIGDYNKQRLIPGIINAYNTNGIFNIRNSGRDIREYIHVDDVVCAYSKIIEHIVKKNEHASFNISSGDRYSTWEILKIIEDNLEAKVNINIVDKDSMEIKRQFMNSNLLKNVTGWYPERSIKKSIGEVVSWYKNTL